jgi:aspartate/methionine/tyrosine aminotransferase
MSAHSDDPLALAGVASAIRRLSVENISSLAKGALGNPGVIPLWFGEGDIPAPAFIGEAMARAVADGHVFYTHQNGIPPLRTALADYLTGLGGRPISPDRITATTSGMHAIMMAVRLTAGAGDSVVVIDPCWPNAAAITEVLGVGVRSVKMDHGRAGWTLDLDKVRRAIDSTVRAIFFASPGNPTGAMIPIDTQAALLDICRARGIWLIADEVYNRLAFGLRSAPTILDHAETEDRVLVTNSFSKSWAMTGWRLGWMVHPPSIGPTLAMLTQYTTSGIATFIQYAGVAAVREGEPFVARMRDYCEAGMEIVCDALDSFGRVRLGPRPTAGMYAFFEVDGMPDSRAACLTILEQTRVGLAPGAFFGAGSEGFLRACVCRSPTDLREAMGRLEAVLD